MRVENKCDLDDAKTSVMTIGDPLFRVAQRYQYLRIEI